MTDATSAAAAAAVAARSRSKAPWCFSNAEREETTPDPRFLPGFPPFNGSQFFLSSLSPPFPTHYHHPATTSPLPHLTYLNLTHGQPHITPLTKYTSLSSLARHLTHTHTRTRIRIRTHARTLRLTLRLTLWTRGRTTLPPCFYLTHYHRGFLTPHRFTFLNPFSSSAFFTPTTSPTLPASSSSRKGPPSSNYVTSSVSKSSPPLAHAPVLYTRRIKH